MPKMVRVDNGEVVEEELPTVGTITLDGEERSVSNYHLLPDAVLKAEGWLPVEDPGLPDFDPVAQEAVDDGYEVLKTKVKLKYRVQERPVNPQADRIAELRGRFLGGNATEEDRDEALAVLLTTIAPEAPNVP